MGKASDNISKICQQTHSLMMDIEKLVRDLELHLPAIEDVVMESSHETAKKALRRIKDNLRLLTW